MCGIKRKPGREKKTPIPSTGKHDPRYRPPAPSKSFATSCVTSFATSCAASFTCLSFRCHLRASVGAAHVWWAYVRTDSLNYTPGSDEHGPRFNRGSGGGARGCNFKERAGAYVHIRGRFLEPTNASVSVATKSTSGISRPKFLKIILTGASSSSSSSGTHAQNTHSAPQAALG